MNAGIVLVCALNERGIADDVDAGVEHIGRLCMRWSYGGEKFRIQKVQGDRPQIVQGVFGFRFDRMTGRKPTDLSLSARPGFAKRLADLPTVASLPSPAMITAKPARAECLEAGVPKNRQGNVAGAATWLRGMREGGICYRG